MIDSDNNALYNVINRKHNIINNNNNKGYFKNKKIPYI